jgi:hypothetical protein
MIRTALIAGFGALLLSCSSEGSDSAGDAEPATVEPRTLAGVYVLSRIDPDPAAPTNEGRRCGELPYHSRIELADSAWSTTDSVYVDCGAALARQTPRVGSASGRFVRRGDTLDLMAADSAIGVHGRVARLVVAGDTLLLDTDALGAWRYGRVR